MAVMVEVFFYFFRSRYLCSVPYVFALQFAFPSRECACPLFRLIFYFRPAR